MSYSLFITNVNLRYYRNRNYEEMEGFEREYCKGPEETGYKKWSTNHKEKNIYYNLVNRAINSSELKPSMAAIYRQLLCYLATWKRRSQHF
jgi:hypothetical protein